MRKNQAPGPISRNESRPQVVRRLIALLRQAHDHECELVVFPECALTSFFPHRWIDDQSQIDLYFERSLPSADAQPLFDEAVRLGIGFCLGYAELVAEDGRLRHFNSAVLVERHGRIVGNYRKVHLPGHAEHRPWHLRERSSHSQRRSQMN